MLCECLIVFRCFFSTSSKHSPDHEHHHRCRHKKVLLQLTDRMSHVEEHLADQSRKIDSLIEYMESIRRGAATSADAPADRDESHGARRRKRNERKTSHRTKDAQEDDEDNDTGGDADAMGRNQNLI